jgi:hypothetical protein
MLQPLLAWLFACFEASAAPLALAILPRLGPVGQPMPNAKAISYSIFVTLGKTFVSDRGTAHTLSSP